MDWMRLDKYEEANNVLADIDWPHSFIREAHIVSPSYILPDSLGTVAPDYLPSARVFISSASRKIPGLELLFVETEEFSAWFNGELEPDISIFEDRVKWKFYKFHASIVSKRLYYRFLEVNSWGRNLHYGWEDVYSEKGELVIL